MEEKNKQAQEGLGEHSKNKFINTGRTILKEDELVSTFKDAKTILGAYGIELPENTNEKYLKASELNSLKNLMADDSLFMSLGGTFLGAVLGVIVNISTSDPIKLSTAAILSIIIFSAIAIIFFILANRSKKRIQKAVEGYI